MAGFGHPGGKCAQTADRSSSMATVSKLQTLAVLWPVLGPLKTNYHTFYYIEEMLTYFRYIDGYIILDIQVTIPYSHLTLYMYLCWSPPPNPS